MTYVTLPVLKIVIISVALGTINWYHCTPTILVNGFTVISGIESTCPINGKKNNRNNINNRIMNEPDINKSGIIEAGICCSSTTIATKSSDIDPSANTENSHLTISSDDFDKDDLFLQELRTRHIPSLFYHNLPIPSLLTTSKEDEKITFIRSNDNGNNFPPYRRHHPNNSMRLYNPTYAMIVSYHGPSFLGGYEYNPNLPTEQKSIRGELSNGLEHVFRDHFSLNEDDNKKNCLKLTSLATAGRTDASVSAKAALMTFSMPVKRFPLLSPLQCQQIIHNFQKYREQEKKSELIRIHSMTSVHAKFHATFDTKSREYIYVWPVLLQGNGKDIELKTTENKDILLAKIMNSLMKPVINKTIDYFSMSQGKLRSQNTDCILYNAECWLYSTITTSTVDYSLKNETETISTRTQVLYQPSLTKERNTCCETFETRYIDVVPEFGKCWNDMLQKQQQLLANTKTTNYIEDETSQKNYGCYVWKVHGNRFLRRMMRKIVSTVWLDAQDIIRDIPSNVTTTKDTFHNSITEYDTMKWLKRIKNNTQNRSHGIKAAPPEGLCLWTIGIDSVNNDYGNKSAHNPL